MVKKEETKPQVRLGFEEGDVVRIISGPFADFNGTINEINADQAKQVYVVKRGQGKGYAGIVNALFYGDNCNMVYGDAAAVLTMMIEAVRGLGAKAAA